MSDTRAAIRELRTLSEKRSRGALSEPETARWMALRRQLGLPPEPVDAPEAPFASEASVGPVAATSPAPAESPQSAPVPTEPREETPTERPPEPASSVASPPAGAENPEAWTGPSIDNPSTAPASSWGGPALDAPAWSDAAAERPTDPGLDGPPPTPFDEAPAARPQPEVRPIELGAAPDEPLQLAPAAEFISYAREGSEGIELPPDSGPEGTFEAMGLADAASQASSHQPTESQAEVLNPEVALAAPTVEASSALQDAATSGQEAKGAEFAESEGAVLLPPAPVPAPESEMAGTMPEEAAAPPTGGVLPLETLAAEVLPDEGAVPITPAPMPPPTVDEGSAPPAPAPLPLETFAPEMLEGAFPLTPVPFETLPPEGSAPVDFTAEQPAAVEGLPAEATASTEEADPSRPPGRHGAPSTWAPGSTSPPVLGAEQFASSGALLGEGGLDPWPEALLPEAPPEEAVETVGDEDLVDEVVTPLPPLPPTPPPGSGGIRGFQFPKPPAGPTPVPVPPSPPSRPQPQAHPSVASDSTARVPLASAVAPTTPLPLRPQPAPASSPLVAPRPAPSSTVPPAPAPFTTAPRTPVPAPRPAAPVPAAATAPVTPAPSPLPSRPVPAAATAPVTPPPAAAGVAPASPPSAASSRRPTPPPQGQVVPPALQPVPPAEDSAMPLLELVDEVTPGQPAARPKATPVPTPSSGTPGMFGPPMMLNPSFVEGEHRVVIHTQEGQVHRGTVHDLDLQDDVVSLQQQDGRLVRIPARRLKAVFFVLAPGGKPPPSRGERVQVTFRDGRQVVGYSEDHASGEPGFFVVPSDARTNTARVYVYRGGVQSVTAG